MKAPFSILILTLSMSLLFTSHSPAADKPDAKEVQKMVEQAKAFLKNTQSDSGGFSERFAGPGVSAIAVAGLIRNGVGPDDPLVASTLKSIEKFIKDDGGIYSRRLANYTTSVAIMALKEANKDGKYDAVLKKAAKFLKGIQYGSSEVKEGDVRYGGTGYDGKSRPDLSNTQFFLDALLAAGIPKDDPAVQRAMKFISRCQNLPGETNDQAFAKKTTEEDKGGLTYTPLDPDDSRHKTPTGGLRSLGAMTYAGLKSFLYAGVSKDDPRVKGAIKWIRRHYTLDENPGMGKAGLYYYYHTFAKAMTALGENPFVDADGKKHNWKMELFEALKKQQLSNGSWINKGDRTFGEGDPNLATAFALLALSYTQ